jgi:DegV family protein with EDD domain
LKGTFKIYPVDSANGSVGLGFLCREARKMDRAGKSVEQIIKAVEAIRDQVRVIVTLDTLDFARMSGRVGTLSAALASVLNVKPIAVLRDGLVNMAEKVRTRKAALDRVVELAKEEYGDRPVYLAVVHARDLESGKILMEKARLALNASEMLITDLSISLAANFGPGTVGLVIYPAG